MEEFSVRELYGGAIEAILPTRLNSLGDMLPIPDTQEVYSDPANHCSYIIELLEMSQIGTDTDAINAIFTDIIEANQATQSTFSDPIPLSNKKFTVKGTMLVNENWVQIYLLVIRLSQFQTDLSFYISDPETLPAEPLQRILSTFSDSLTVKDNSLFV